MNRPLISLIGALGFVGTAHAATQYNTPTPLSLPGWANTSLWDVNDSGLIVGSARSQDNNFSIGFIYSRGTFSTIARPGSSYTEATGVANNGTVVGSFDHNDGFGANGHGFIYSGGVYTDFDVPGATYTFIRHISSNGRYLTGDWRVANGFTNGFVHDILSGKTWVFEEPNTFIFTQGANNGGLVTGSITGRRVGFIFDVSTNQRVEYAVSDGLIFPRFRDINENGEVVGFATSAPSGPVGFAGRPDDLFQFVAPQGMQSIAYGLNDSGTVVGWYSEIGRGVTHGWIATAAVPEPSTVVLFGAGVLIIAATRRRRPAAPTA